MIGEKRRRKNKKRKKAVSENKTKKPKNPNINPKQQTTRLLEDCTFFCFTHGYICNKSDGWY